MAELDRSVAEVLALLRGGGDLRELLALTTARRGLSLSDLTPDAQAALLAERADVVQPSADALAARIASAATAGRPLVAKFTVEPFGAEFHLGNVVPLLVLDRLRRMGHEVVIVLGDVTAKAGDASGAVAGVPRLTDDLIHRNFAAYRAQVAPFVDFGSVRVRHNADWLADLRLPRLLAVAARVPLSLWSHEEPATVAQLLHATAKAMDSIEVGADLEVGGRYLTDAMAVCRHVMAAEGLDPEITLTTPLVEGVDGGALMSASRGNHVPLSASAPEVFTRVRAIAHRLVVPYLRALTEWRDVEIDAALAGLTPERLRVAVAAEVTAALHGYPAARHELDIHCHKTEEGTGR
ncbi:hypothetical protein CFP65_3075 [Kitasatospora sp. MMS16-BH015]|uniref:tyrosine--tRNA ligase n=1 Tax=Kitasatospora sp. MMS16-BH015 TaxID=2018025 RepID=UPI000CA3ADAF|nr:tyrosine--tRNA ligase [Kitasatospora sp. MMS16-BH015]AUG77883.1 hypothetical protein CFP65_3075 [Kitasatospora sp. MMS16-BH015]